MDIDERTYTLDADALAAAITPATRAVIPVDLYGQPADMDGDLPKWRVQHGLPVIDDAAQAHGATFGGRRAVHWPMSLASVSIPARIWARTATPGPSSQMTRAMAERVRLLRNHGRREKYVHEVVGLRRARWTRCRPPCWTQNCPTWRLDSGRRSPGALGTTSLEGAGLVLPLGRPARSRRGISMWCVCRRQFREALVAHLRLQGIETGMHYPLPLHLQPAYAALGYRRGELPVTEAVAESCLSLPLYPEMTDAQQDRVVDAVCGFCEATSDWRKAAAERGARNPLAAPASSIVTGETGAGRGEQIRGAPGHQRDGACAQRGGDDRSRWSSAAIEAFDALGCSGEVLVVE